MKNHEWLPMESAPRDGTNILVSTARAGHSVVIMHWDSDSFARKPRPFFRQWAGLWGVRGDRACQPLAWMPLPEAFLTPAAPKEPEKKEA